MDQKLWLSLTRVPGLDKKMLLALFEQSITGDDLGTEKFRGLVGQEVFQKVNSRSYLAGLQEETERLLRAHREQGIEIITYTSERYPESFRKIANPPLALFCKGDLAALQIYKKVAIIGSRSATAKGVAKAKEIAVRFAEMGYAVIGGLSRGIDTGAHLGALEAKGITIAILPGGHDDIKPKSSISLAGRIVENGGLLVSEYPLGHDFVIQNYIEYCRLQSGLALGVCAVQTDVGSGTMYTVAFAKSQGKVVFCPEPPLEEIPQYRGVRKLLLEGRAVLFSGDYNLFDSLMCRPS